MGSLSIGSVVFVHFPFSDLSGSKKRPALVLAVLPKNDVILCQITSKDYADENAIELRQQDFSKGRLIQLSYIRPSKIFTANTSIIEIVVAQVHPRIQQETVDHIERILRS
ncbi:MAG: type II toxin-antitoxin system PemK/MazF family toxin [Thiomicrospira sp.]|nr:type II toxin-antitoxin system PemK/MazF family toxin [Thiomicrospira sp.]NCP58063.1 type II toxin-antitoxin system PemK/MazF family toxin [Thiomicrospira sp.]OIP96272.1 MAG: hypothetical protein AUK56_02575 [Thiomicrospira sp. CG2_30_44_34]PIQ04300.1 MAG: hypothetical protein COW74_05340 [Piscirickettsiaceae bacterium CG18_big_fil_WC_8_21_14_2_50_44_103]PIU37789.1 MAG: hypothetical protein COT01_10015 [Piscirickettsiaceae bacterium CG07_land_8_20_14_0_80_44_28]